ncbi:hypothetical protein GGTG_09170 [Gaeumannomyces tritici R3-111a-1]|uniref:Uncharacterized protein n=1 Tax=Gaeumannomyces tritici (strain R3-111a-1) TaxID=644352 RepID=J3P6M8_GAET3|nr:hypothetical protein GGTG_09170 [Gaeumannomyces tritici R3-111a-1]EJT72304.1 hypothetical protein GGTG_09170 [Gaeumannomyces tritici R3-111a-1]
MLVCFKKSVKSFAKHGFKSVKRKMGMHAKFSGKAKKTLRGALIIYFSKKRKIPLIITAFWLKTKGWQLTNWKTLFIILITKNTKSQMCEILKITLFIIFLKRNVCIFALKTYLAI